MSTKCLHLKLCAAAAAIALPLAAHAQPQPAPAAAPRISAAEAAAAGEAARVEREAAAATRAESRARANADTQLERELAAARGRLEAAAREVAQLSTRLSGDVLRFHAGGEGRPMLGVQLGEAVARGGVRVRSVSPGGPAEEAGVRSGDVIVAIDGQKVRDAEQVVQRVRPLAPGAQTKLDVERDGKVRTFVVATRVVDPRVVLMLDPEDFELPMEPAEAVDPEDPMPPTAVFGRAFPAFGPWGDLEFATLTKDLGRYFGAEQGVLVIRAGADGALKLRDGDVITAIGGREPQSGSHALRILRSYQPGETISIAALRDRKPIRIEATVPEPRRGFRVPHAAAPAARAAPAAPAKPAAPSAPDRATAPDRADAEDADAT